LDELGEEKGGGKEHERGKLSRESGSARKKRRSIWKTEQSLRWEGKKEKAQREKK